MEIFNEKKHWKWGIFYFNPDDRRIFPPKRLPFMGWTVNFANWKSILVFVVVLLLFVLAVRIL